MRVLTALTVLLTTFSSPLAFAQELQEPQEDLLSFGLGWYDVLDDQDAVDFRLEYRPDTTVLWKLKPWFGAEVTSDTSVWAGGGVLLDMNLTDSVYLTPSFGVGLYDEGSSDKDLDYPIEFRSQLETGYKFEGGSRVGVAFGHISNASLGDSNPGTEILNVYYHVPYSGFFN